MSYPNVERQNSHHYTDCYVFVDHSNLWIAGQTAYAVKLEDADRDPRYRVDLGKFLELITKERNISKAFLYGSVPPPNDTVWRAAREKNFEVKTFKRSGSGREKELDVAMAHEITKTLYELMYTGSLENVIFITVTGDRDLKPPIEDALEKGVPVELWSWDNSMAREFRRLANTNKNFTATALDHVQQDFSYTAYMSTRNKRDIDPKCAIVYKDIPRGKKYIYQLADHIARLMRLFYVTSHDYKTEDKQDLIFEFPKTTSEVVFRKLRKIEELEYKPCSYPEYMSALREDVKPIQTTNRYVACGDIDNESLPDVVESSMSTNICEILSESSLETSDYKESCSEESEDDWSIVVRKKAGRMTRNKKRKDMQCHWEDHCVKKSECPYFHSDYEKKLFTKFPSNNFKFWKTKICEKNTKHSTPDQQKWCPFAHNEEDSWCLRCKMYGHLTDDCKVTP